MYKDSYPRQVIEVGINVLVELHNLENKKAPYFNGELFNI
jgi:hypothetical protein|tara:strand:+ start:450 stop:569 length:120 start_codon:yes stop_codon:yes gene_type:complete